MNCVKCLSRTNVTNTFKHDAGVLRRRKCFECGDVFMTLESAYTPPVKVKPVKPVPINNRRDTALIARLKEEIRQRNETKE